MTITNALYNLIEETPIETRKKIMNVLSLHSYNLPQQAYINLLSALSPLIDRPLDLLNIGRQGVGKDRCSVELLVYALGLPHCVSFTHVTFASFRDCLVSRYSTDHTLIFPELNTIFRGGEHSEGMVEFLKTALDHKSVRVKLKTEDELYVKRFRSSIIGNVNTTAFRSEDYYAMLSRVVFVSYPQGREYTCRVLDYMATRQYDQIYDSIEWISLKAYIEYLCSRSRYVKFYEHQEGITVLKEDIKRVFEEVEEYNSAREFLLGKKLAILDAFATKGFRYDEVPVTIENYWFASKVIEENIREKARWIGEYNGKMSRVWK